jgi:hypothetical protein
MCVKPSFKMLHIEKKFIVMNHDYVFNIKNKNSLNKIYKECSTINGIK